ncbi:hypothetical protein VNI00_013305 [Paramarasmius palmivorus]|uniref:Delta-endotoxin CytB n=1 Tax=Paramarasmius palmivorus TaxID=297713 RepID=A0AAW0C121_9AGAR
MSGEDPVYFDQFSKLPPNLVITAIEVTKFAAHYVNLEDPKSFKWQEFLDGINSYPGKLIVPNSLQIKCDDLAMDKFQNNTINQQTATVQTMVDKIVDFLRVVLSVALSGADIAALAKNIETTFTDLRTAKENGWADFSKSSSSNNSSWQYRVQFAFPNPDLPDYFYSLVTTIKLEADIKEESSWWGLESSTQKNFSAVIDAMQLIVSQGFKDPRKPV